jgi:hypothetical protein
MRAQSLKRLERSSPSRGDLVQTAPRGLKAAIRTIVPFRDEVVLVAAGRLTVVGRVDVVGRVSATHHWLEGNQVLDRDGRQPASSSNSRAAATAKSSPSST